MANWRYHMICTDAAKSATLGFMAGVGAAGGFSVPLNATGSTDDPTTHWGQSVQLTDAQKAAVDAATAGATFPADSYWWRDDAARLVSAQLFRDSNFSGTTAVIGHPWTFGDACSDVGVQ